MNTVNPLVQSWFASGHASEALIGEPPYFIRESTFGDHDDILVLHQLFTWAEDGHANEAASAILAAVGGLRRSDRPEDAVRLVWSYIIVARGLRLGLPIDLRVLRTILDDSLAEAAGRLSPDLTERVAREYEWLYELPTLGHDGGAPKPGS